MLIQEKIAVAAIILAAAVYLARLASAKYRARHEKNTCAGCGCGKAAGIAKPFGPPASPRAALSGPGTPSATSRSRR